MKVQFFGGSSFSVIGAEQKLMFNATTDLDAFDLALSSENKGHTKGAKKTFGLPGEFEISDILVRGFRTENGKNTIFKVFLEQTSLVHFGALTEVPAATVLKELGENIDVAFIVVSDEFTAKKAKALIDAVEPRLVLIGGATSQFAALNGLMMVETIETPVLDVKKSALSDEKTEVKILTVDA